MKKKRLKRDFDYWIDEYMYNCRSRKLRPKMWLKVTIHTQLSYSFFTTILDFGEHAKILSPKEAIGEFFEYIKKGMKEMDELYGYGSPEFLADVPTNYDALRAQKHKFKHTPRIRKRK